MVTHRFLTYMQIAEIVVRIPTGILLCRLSKYVRWSAVKFFYQSISLRMVPKGVDFLDLQYLAYFMNEIR